MQLELPYLVVDKGYIGRQKIKGDEGSSCIVLPVWRWEGETSVCIIIIGLTSGWRDREREDVFPYSMAEHTLQHTASY